MAPASATSVRFRRCTSDSGDSRGTSTSLRRSLSTTSAARSIRLRLVPCAIAATVPMEQGQMTIPALFADPDAGSAPRSLSSNTRTVPQSPPVAFFSSRSSLMPHSSVSSRQPWLEIMSQVGTWCMARISSKRTPYGAPEAPVMARMTGSLLSALSGLKWGYAGDVRAAVQERGSGERGEGRSDAPHASGAAARTSPHSPLPFSYDAIYEGSEKDDDRHDPVRRKKGRIEPAQVP